MNAIAPFRGALAAVLLFAGMSRAATAEGRWRTIDDKTGKPTAVVRIEARGGFLTGTVERLFPAPGEDPNPLCTACEGSLRNKPILGMRILWDLQAVDAGWGGGRILDPDNGVVYRCKMMPAGTDRLEVRGYVGISLLGRSQIWVREK